MRRRRRVAWRVAVVLLLSAAAALLGCGGGGGDRSTAAPGEVLFAGTASQFLPHVTGQSAAFGVTATSDDGTQSSGFTTRVEENSTGGAFLTRQTSAAGDQAEALWRDLGDEIRVERVRQLEADGAVVERVVDPPAVVVRTPVVAGETIATGFARSLEVAIEIDGKVERRRTWFLGETSRTPTGRVDASVPAGEFRGAIRYAVQATGRTALAVAGTVVEIELDEDGEEIYAPGVGALREEVDLTIRSGDASASARVVTERLGAGEVVEAEVSTLPAVGLPGPRRRSTAGPATAAGRAGDRTDPRR